MGIFSRFRNKSLQRKNIGKCNSVEGELRDNVGKSKQEYDYASKKRRDYERHISLLELSQQRITRREFDKRDTEDITIQSIADNITHMNEGVKNATQKQIVDFLGTSNLQVAAEKYKQIEREVSDIHTKYLIDRAVLYKFQDWRVGVGEESWDEAKARAKAEREVKSI